MSAFIVSDEQVDFILSAYNQARRINREGGLEEEELTRLGRCLLRENSISVAYRYNETVATAWELYEYKQIDTGDAVIQAHKFINCLEYQSCEHPGWESSEAYKLCAGIKDDLIKSTKEWERAKWSI